MIKIAGVIYASPRSSFGRWRYQANEVTIACDVGGCDATCTPKGMEHNGGEIESIYLGDDNSGWWLGGWYGEQKDYCPFHAPKFTECARCGADNNQETGLCADCAPQGANRSGPG